MEEFNYFFQVIPQNFELQVDNLKPYVKTELKRLKIEGTLQTADYAESESVEKIVTATQASKELKVSWQHSGEGKQHAFVIEEVTRTEQAGEVKINTNGRSINVDRTSEETVTVPAVGDFKIMNARVVQNPNQYVAIQFSDPLKEKQALDGLISVGDNRGLQLDFDIHD
ncbi:MAG: hypothetical protein ACKPFK_27505, partial [Dolichospermum sp.]